MLELKNITKTFPGVKALQNVSLQFRGGEVHALVGENGAGKSTLMNIIAGNLQPDKGEIFWNGEKVKLLNRQDAQQLGIGIVYQERSLVDSLSIAENIFPGNQPTSRWGFVDFQKLYQQTIILLQQLGIEDLSPKAIAGRLSPAQKSIVEFAKALAQNPSLLVLDEPTASITHQETKTLFRIISDLKQKGVAVIYSSHRMAEIKEVADNVSVLKDGVFQGTVDAKTTPVNEIVRMMVGRELGTGVFESHRRDEPVLEVNNLTGKGFSNISFQLFRGEILGFAGLLGSGRTELARALFGDHPVVGGTITKDGRTVYLNHPADAMKNNIAYVPDDRKSLGIFLEKTVAENIAVAKFKGSWYREKAAVQEATGFCESLRIKTSSVNRIVRQLSGGNQQKVVMAKWLNTAPDLLIFNEPTHGVDIGAKGDIYALLKKLTAEGKSILLVSSELTELLLLADRIAVMYNGKIQKILNHENATEEKLAALASGIQSES